MLVPCVVGCAGYPLEDILALEFYTLEVSDAVDVNGLPLYVKPANGDWICYDDFFSALLHDDSFGKRVSAGFLPNLSEDRKEAAQQ